MVLCILFSLPVDVNRRNATRQNNHTMKKEKAYWYYRARTDDQRKLIFSPPRIFAYVPYRTCERRIPSLSKNEKMSPLKTVDKMAIVPLHGWTGRQGGLVQSKRFPNVYWPDLSYWYSFVAKTISCTFKCVIHIIIRAND